MIKIRKFEITKSIIKMKIIDWQNVSTLYVAVNKLCRHMNA